MYDIQEDCKNTFPPTQQASLTKTNNVQFDPGFIENFLFEFPEHALRIDDMMHRFHQKHYSFKNRNRGSYTLSRFVNNLSRMLWDWHNQFPEFWWLGPIAEDLCRFQEELQVGPHREWYYTMPRRKYFIAPWQTRGSCSPCVSDCEIPTSSGARLGLHSMVHIIACNILMTLFLILLSISTVFYFVLHILLLCIVYTS